MMNDMKFDFCKALDYFENVVTERLRKEGFPLPFLRLDAVRQYLVEMLCEQECKVTQYTATHPERLLIGIERVYENAKKVAEKFRMERWKDNPFDSLGE